MVEVEVTENDLNSLFTTTLEIIAAVAARWIWAGEQG
jgi:hypothetical protein